MTKPQDLHPVVMKVLDELSERYFIHKAPLILHEGGPEMVPPLTFMGWGRCSTQVTTDTAGNPCVDNGVEWYTGGGTESDLRTT